MENFIISGIKKNNMSSITTEQIIAILSIFITASVSVLAYLNNKRDVETRHTLAAIEKEKLDIEEKRTDSDASKLAIENASKVYEQINELLDMVKRLSDENLNLRKQFGIIQNENSMLKDRLGILEKAFLENPVYNVFFKSTKFACAIIKSSDGTFFDINNSFCEMYGYNEKELKNMSIFDLSLQRDETRKTLNSPDNTHITDRLHKNKSGQSFLVEIHLVHHFFNDEEYVLGVFIPRVKVALSARIQDMLLSIISEYSSDYATLWAIHNHGKNKISGIYESVKRGNAYLFQDYRMIPSTIFDDLFQEIILKKYIILRQDDDKFDSTRATLKHSDLYCIMFAGVFDDNELIGMLSTSWRDSNPNIGEQQVEQFIKYSKSDVICEIIRNELNQI